MLALLASPWSAIMPSLMAKVSTALRTLPTEVTAMMMAVTAWLLVAAEVPRSLVSAKVRWALLRATTTEMSHRRTLRAHVAAKVLGTLLRTVATELPVLWALGAHVTAKVRWALLRTATAEKAHRRTLRAHVAAKVLRTVATELSVLRALGAHVTSEVLRSIAGSVLRTTIPAVVALRAGMLRSLLMVGIPASHVAVLLMALPVRLTLRLSMMLSVLVSWARRLMLRPLRRPGRWRRVFPVRLTG